jgi:hypothetical protein
MKASIKPVKFLNWNGLKLFGMLHIPKNEFRDIGIIILSPGIKSRVAPHRLYLKMAERFCDLGFTVLRFDPEGLGDSEGEIVENFAADVYGSIQIGRFLDDTRCAMDWMQKKSKLSKFILTGLCGGAITGLLSGANDERVIGLLGLGIPVILDSSSIDQSKYITKGQLMDLRKLYIEKLLSPKAWIRFLTFKSDYLVLIKSMLTGVSKKFTKPVRTNHLEAMESQNQVSTQNNNFNSYFPLAFRQMADGNKKMLLLFSESDRLYWEFEEKFMHPYKEVFNEHRGICEISIISDANHIFSFSKWQLEMLEISEFWITKNFTNC